MNVPRLENAVQTTSDFHRLCQHLEDHHRIEPMLASERLHYLKESTGRRGDDDLTFDLTGNVYDPATGEYLGSLTQGGRKMRS